MTGAVHPDVRARAAAVSRRALWTLPLLGAYILFFGDNFYFGFDLTLAPLWLKHHVGASIVFIGLSYAVWALPNVSLTPYGGRIADRMRRSTLILIFGILQIPCYIAFAFINSVTVALVVFAIHGAIYAMMQPAVDANLAAFSPPAARARAQGLYGAIGTGGAFIAANTLSALYGVNFRLPLFVMAAAFGVCVLIGGTMVRIAEGRSLGIRSNRRKPRPRGSRINRSFLSAWDLSDTMCPLDERPGQAHSSGEGEPCSEASDGSGDHRNLT